jgi:hypothetical protein
MIVAARRHRTVAADAAEGEGEDVAALPRPAAHSVIVDAHAKEGCGLPGARGPSRMMALGLGLRWIRPATAMTTTAMMTTATANDALGAGGADPPADADSSYCRRRQRRR